MRVRAAYISSFGTTTILVAASLFLLAAVSTIVAFRGWPDSINGTGVESVPLSPGAAPQRAAELTRSPAVHRAAKPKKHPATARRHRSTAGLVKDPTARRHHAVVPGLVMVPRSPTPMVPTTTTPGSVTQAVPPAPAAPVDAPPADPAGPGGGLPANRDGVPLPDLGDAQLPGPGVSEQLTTVAGALLTSLPPLP